MSSQGYQNFFQSLNVNKRQECNLVIGQMTTARDKYKQIIRDHYSKQDREGKLLPPNRSATRENISEDVKFYDELVEHCLRAGDAEILYDWGLDFIREEGGLSRLASRDLTVYRNAFSRLVANSKHATERVYMALLRDTFSDLVSNPGSVMENLRTFNRRIER
ncbi:MAG: hypothetical protein AAF703_17360 [Cyanobacteria bacterium P01_D01_bin.105]|mgnify:CR=1 FL=1